MTDIEKKTGMTDAECEYWDEYFTKNTVHLGPNLLERGVKPGFAHEYLALSKLDHDVLEVVPRKSSRTGEPVVANK